MTRVFLVDDNVECRDAVAELLRVYGCAVIEAGSGIEALWRIPAIRPDVVVMDLALPDLDGCEVVRTIVTRCSVRPRFVALTGSSRAADTTRAVEAGFDAFLVKPCDTDELVAAVVNVPIVLAQRKSS